MANMNDGKKIGHEIKKLSHAVGRKIEFNMRSKGIDSATAMHGMIMGFIRRNSERDVFQRDVEQFFNISRSTVTNILQLMEKKGYIIRESSQTDARLKKLKLTELGRSEDERILGCLMETDAELVDGIPKDKLETFYEVVSLISENCEKHI